MAHEVVENWEGTDLFGNPASLRFPRARGLFLLYVATDCDVCARLLPAARHFIMEIAAVADSAWVILEGSPQAQLHYARVNGLYTHPVFQAAHLPADWRTGTAPFGLWIDAAGRVVARGTLRPDRQIASLYEAAKQGDSSRP